MLQQFSRLGKTTKKPANSILAVHLCWVNLLLYKSTRAKPRCPPESGTQDLRILFKCMTCMGFYAKHKYEQHRKMACFAPNHPLSSSLGMLDNEVEILLAMCVYRTNQHYLQCRYCKVYFSTLHGQTQLWFHAKLHASELLHQRASLHEAKRELWRILDQSQDTLPSTCLLCT